MSIHRYNARTDANDTELVKLARRLGARVFRIRTPVDLMVLWRGQWHPVELKLPKKPYTTAQKGFLAEAHENGGKVWTWREESDVFRDLGVQA